MRYTEYHAGKAVIKDRSLLAEAMEKLARLEDAEDTNVPGKWIPISERLPEESLKSVIGWDAYRKRCCFVQYLNGGFVLGNGEDIVEIIAWMPLPEPYREVTDEENLESRR